VPASGFAGAAQEVEEQSRGDLDRQRLQFTGVVQFDEQCLDRRDHELVVECAGAFLAEDPDDLPQ